MSASNLTSRISEYPSSVDGTVVLLTATIDAGAMTSLKRSDPRLRLRDYEVALRLWLRVESHTSIIFCENSGYDLTSLKEIANASNNLGKTVEFYSFDDREYPRALGKGYGELRIIRMVLGCSTLIGPRTFVLKSTGRHYLQNAASILAAIRRGPEAELYCDLRANGAWADSRVFCASELFLSRFLLPLSDLADDSKGITMEHVLARAAHACMAAGFSWSMFPYYLDIRGVSATTGEVYPSSVVSRVSRKTFHRLKLFCLERGMPHLIGGA